MRGCTEETAMRDLLPAPRIIDRTERHEGWTIPYVAAWCGVTERTVTRWISAGKLTGWRWMERSGDCPIRVIDPETVMAFYVRYFLTHSKHETQIECAVCGRLFAPRNECARFCSFRCQCKSTHHRTRERRTKGAVK